MSWLTIRGPGVERSTEEPPQTRTIIKKREASPDILLASQNEWCATRKDPESSDGSEKTQKLIATETMSHEAEKFSWVPSCFPLQAPLSQ